MQKRKIKALTLSKETLLSLDKHLQTVRGGFVPADPSTESTDPLSVFMHCTSC
ncbi:MAG: hypothetical protein ACJ76Y_07010 [Thermoanaerobaculia bacterium]|jgi:hypothetical protein